MSYIGSMMQSYNKQPHHKTISGCERDSPYSQFQIIRFQRTSKFLRDVLLEYYIGIELPSSIKMQATVFPEATRRHSFSTSRPTDFAGNLNDFAIAVSPPGICTTFSIMEARMREPRAVVHVRC
jgi:hypothetical protein